MMTTVSQLDDQINTPYPRSILHCEICNSEYSANKGDYFSCLPEQVLSCCDIPLSHVVKETHLTPVQK